MKRDIQMIDVSTRNRRMGKDEQEKRRRSKSRARKKALKRQRQLRMIQMAVVIIVMVLVSAFVGRIDKERILTVFKDVLEFDIETAIGDKTPYASYNLLYEVEYAEFFAENKPQVRSEIEVYNRLKELTEEYSELEEIYDRREEYPVKMLASLCNNIEIHEFVKGYLKYIDGEMSIPGEVKLNDAEKEQRCPLFLQWDKRWGYESYGDFNIAMSGCGPTTLAMAATAITGKECYTPDVVAEYSMNHGFYVEGTGTAWSLMTEGASEFGLAAKEISLDENVMKREIDDGNVIICSMRPGEFTSVGHFIMIYAYDENGFRINDANSIFRSSRSWTFEELKSQIRILWSYEEKTGKM